MKQFNEITNKFSLSGDKFMPEMNVPWNSCTYGSLQLRAVLADHLLKNKERTQKLRQTEYLRCIY